MASINYAQTVPLLKGRSKVAKQIIGNKYVLLTVLEYLGYYKKPSGTTVQIVLCKCDCGKTRKCEPYLLMTGQLKSCGCMSYKWGTEKRTKHGHTAGEKGFTPEYSAWLSMKQRCYTKTCPQFEDYGGRGIKVCDRWLQEEGFDNFILDMGIRPSIQHSLDRFPNVNGDYEKSNCRWATRKEQMNNTRRNRYIETSLGKLSLTEYSEQYGMSYYETRKLYKRLNPGINFKL